MEISLDARLLGIAAAVVTTAFVIELLRRGILREKFAAMWLLVSAGLLVLAVFPGTLSWAAGILGVEVPSNLLFFVAGIVLLLISVQLSFEVSRLESRTQRLAEDLAILRVEFEHQKEGP